MAHTPARQSNKKSRRSGVRSAAPAPSFPTSDKALLPLGALMLAASVSGWAQSNAAADAPADKTLKPVIVKEKAEAPEGKDALQTKKTNIGKGTQDIRDIPQSISVITERLLDDRKLDTLREALHHTAGITFAATENGTDQDIRLRGFPVATVGDLLIDGMRDPSQYDRDAFNYDRIEVMRGSASMVFGRGSTGGVINQVTKQPMLIDQNDVEFTVGSRGYVRTTGDFNLKTGDDAALRMNVMVNKANNGGAKIDKYGIAPTYRWGIGTRDEFSVGLFHLDVDNVPPAGIRWLGGGVPNIKPGNFYGTASDFLTGKATYGTFKHTHRFDDGGELRSQLRTGTFDRAQWGTSAGFPGAPLNPVAVTPFNLSGNTVLTRAGLTPRKDRYDGTYLQSDYSNKFNWFGLKHEFLAGIDAARETADRYQSANGIGANYNKGNTTIGTPDDGRTLPITPTWRDSSGYASNSLGAYVQDLVQVAPDWKLLGGIRYDSFKGNFKQFGYSSAGAPTGTTNTQLSDSLFSYRAGVLYQPTPTSSFHFSYGTSFNTSADTYQYVTPQNANTPPEKSRNIELGAKLDWLDGKLSTRAALFRTEKYNERTTDADFAGTAYTLSGKRHSAGLELDVVGRLTPQWEIYLSYAYTPVAKIDQAGSAAAAQASVGQRVGLTPKHSGSAWVSYQATPKLRVAGGINGASENFALQGTSGAAQLTARAAGYVVADAMVEYKFTEETYMQVNVSNISNKLYGDQLYPGFVISGVPRTVKLTIGTRF
ncbi:TonB-dependent receptor [Variovorax terrae]|uniref:TonB-dependent siderophore receptor n=1 Tax=Variovorax terrae TaxID=2923278 RepID=A0A9X1VV92_9BURK|nr:TonB-dependent siderophore receptor [Variovorax terrae]MCJ0763794.1 TonB-dependent siderophore receptor [Variovorax terrae]